MISAERGAVVWPPLSRQTVSDAAKWAWHSKRLFSIVLLVVAVLLVAKLNLVEVRAR